MLDIPRLNEEIEKVTYWIYEYVRRAGARGVVIGNSGGKDCATVIALATKALGKERVYSVAIPCSSIHQDLEDAKLVSDTFEIPLLEVDLTSCYQNMEERINQALEENNLVSPISEEAGINAKPRLRMTTLYTIAQTLGCLVMGTGNLCERMVGYTTKWGDSSSDLNPIANFTVEEVRYIGERLGVPEKIIQKAPNDGLGGKTDEEKMGITYEQIAQYIETGRTEEEAMKEIERRYLGSMHKRCEIPTYEVEGRENLLEKQKGIWG